MEGGREGGREREWRGEGGQMRGTYPHTASWLTSTVRSVAEAEPSKKDAAPTATVAGILRTDQ